MLKVNKGSHGLKKNGILWRKQIHKMETPPQYSTILYYYITILYYIDDQNGNPNINNRDHLVGQLTTPPVPL